MELLFGAFLGIVFWEIGRYIWVNKEYPVSASCIHCKNRGESLLISGSEKEEITHLLNEHKSEVHPYAA